MFNPHDDQFSTKLIARWLPSVTLTWWGKVLVVVLELTMVGFAIYGCTQVYMDFNYRELFVPKVRDEWLMGWLLARSSAPTAKQRNGAAAAARAAAPHPTAPPL